MTATTHPKRPVQSLVDTATATRADIAKLRERATAALEQELSGIAEAARSGADQALRLKRRFALEEIVNAGAWLAGDLIDVLVKIAAGTDPNPVMASDLARKIRDAEIRLEILREMSR